jgi:hypothetical protein
MERPAQDLFGGVKDRDVRGRPFGENPATLVGGGSEVDDSVCEEHERWFVRDGDPGVALVGP